MSDSEQSVGYQPIPIQFQVPKELGGELKKSVIMRPPTTEDVELAQLMAQSPVHKDILLYANLTETSEEFVRSLAFYDFRQLESAFDAFMCPVFDHVDKRALFLPKPLEATASKS
ncbi:phage tail assembly protein [Endozoicomonas ascidiicola]|uniref:phage tail assembly protein n=1 Tax=Endozoicomonas ascidiicola TaxID=1698521 RepID=UPI0008297E0D|nr:phage tail assembly protein [Endozoicomonas ascidiicola]